MVWTLDCQGDRGGEPCWPCDHAPDVLSDSMTSDTWWRRRDGHWARGCGPSWHGGARLSPGPQHSGHNINSTTSSAPTTIEQRQSRPGARLVQGARCWWHRGRTQHIWQTGENYLICSDKFRFNPINNENIYLSFKWRKAQFRIMSEIIILIYVLVIHNLDLTCGTWKSSWHQHSANLS